MDTAQPGILLPAPECCRYLTFGLAPGADPGGGLGRLQDYDLGEGMVVEAVEAVAVKVPPGNVLKIIMVNLKICPCL